MSQSSGVTRRTFLTAAVGVAASPYVIPASALGADGRPAPSDRVALGCIGLGGRGGTDLKSFLADDRVGVTALCDVDTGSRRYHGNKEKGLTRAKQWVEGHKAAGKNRGVYTTQDFREVLARDDVDAVCIATPDHWHAAMVTAAAKADKDIYCEKPVSLTVADGRAMVRAVRRYGRVFQCGSQRRSSETVRRVCELVRNGRMSDMKTVAASRLCICVALFLAALPCRVFADSPNQLSRQEKAEGFKLLFDGKSMGQWRNYRSDTDTIRPQWQIVDEAMVLTAKGGRDLITKERFRHFDLRLQYTIAEGGNSGILLRVVEDPGEKLSWRLAPEFQLFDSYNVKVRGQRSAGALYGLVAAPQNIAGKPGQWNDVRILLEPAADNADRLRCCLGDTQTVDLVVDRSPQSEWSKLIKRHNQEKSGTKYELPPAFFQAETGHILLQDHGARVAFRNIRIRKLNATESE